MSIFFVDERHPHVDPVPLVPDWDEALLRVSRREDVHAVSVFGQITVEQARDLVQTCRRLEPLLLKAIQDGVVTTQASAGDFIQANTEGFFPRVKFIQRMKEVVGSEATPATWAEVVAAAMTEEVG